MISTIPDSDLQGSGNSLDGASPTDLEDEENDKARTPSFEGVVQEARISASDFF